MPALSVLFFDRELSDARLGNCTSDKTEGSNQMRRIVLLLALALFAGAPEGIVLPVSAIQLVSVEVGIIELPAQYPCRWKAKTSRWAANDWDTHIVIQQREVREGDRVVAEVSTPNGRVFRRTSSSRSTAAAGCTPQFVPILGTDAETWLGTWKAMVSLNDKSVAEISWEVVAARDMLPEYQAELLADPKSARRHYRVGAAAAALTGQDALAESELKEAQKLSPTWWYPYLALGRLYQRQGKKEAALEQFNFLRGLLLGRGADPGSFLEYVQAMLDDHLRQLQ